MIRVVVELTDGMPDDPDHDAQRLGMLGHIIRLSYNEIPDLTDGANVIGARVIGTFEPSEHVRDYGKVKPL